MLSRAGSVLTPEKTFVASFVRRCSNLRVSLATVSTAPRSRLTVTVAPRRVSGSTGSGEQKTRGAEARRGPGLNRHIDGDHAALQSPGALFFVSFVACD